MSTPMAYTATVHTKPWLSVIETQSYLVQAKKLLKEEEQKAIVDMIATDPTCGEVIPETNGIRKVRFAVQGRGKSGGVRVIYFFCNEAAPAFLLAVFGKNEKANLSKEDRNQLAKVTEALKRRIKEVNHG